MMTTCSCHSNIKVCHCGHLMPKSRVSHITPPARPLACLRVRRSKLCFLRAFFWSVGHFPMQVSVAIVVRSSSTARSFISKNKESNTDTAKWSAQWAIGATRCGDKFVNTVLLETQGSFGSVRRCRDVTVTHDTKCTGQSFTPVTLVVTFAGSSEGPKHRSGRFHVSGTPQLHQKGIGLTKHHESEKFKYRNSATVPVFPRRFPLPVFCLDFETLLSKSHVKDTCTQRFIQSVRSHHLRQLI